MAELIDKLNKETQERTASERLQKIEQDLIEQEYNENESPSVINMIIEMGGINDSFYSGEMKMFSFKESGIKGIINKSSKTSFARMAESIAERTGNENHRDANWLIDAIANEIPRFKRNENRFKAEETGAIKENEQWQPGEWDYSLPTDVLTLTNIDNMRGTKGEKVVNQPRAELYAMAKKHQDVKAAAKLVEEIIKAKPENIQAIKELSKYKGASIVYPDSFESKGNNKIPHAFAEAISGLTGLEIDNDIKQSNIVSNTGKGTYIRFVMRPKFSGKVIAGKQYILVDDVSANGGTFSEMKQYIEANGGKVVRVVSIAAGTSLNRASKQLALGKDIKPVKLFKKDTEKTR